MRKKSALIFTVAALIAVLSLCAACSSTGDLPKPQSLTVKDALEGDNTVFGLFEEFCNIEDRFYSSVGSHNAARYLADKMNEYGMQPLPVSARLNLPGGETSVAGADAFIATANQTSRSINLYFRRPADGGQSLGTVLLLAHYDNLFGSYLDGKLITATGAYDNAAAVATVLNTARVISESDVNIPYDIVFAFLSATNVAGRDGTLYYSWSGASQMLKTLDSLNMTDSVVLALNAWRLGGGENLYMYSYDRATTYNDYFYDVAGVNQLSFTRVPEYKRSFSIGAAATVSPDVQSPTGQIHIGMLNDSIIFMNKGIPTLTYLSLDWSDISNPGYTEKSGFSNCAYTDSDTLNNMVLVNGAGETGKQNICAQLNAVTINLISALEGDNGKILAKALTTADDELKSISSAADAMYYTGLGITIAAIIALITLYIVLRGKNVKRLNEEGGKRPPSFGGGTGAQNGSPFEDFPSEEKIFDDFD